jgi:PAS domain S-box-containing protein
MAAFVKAADWRSPGPTQESATASLPCDVAAAVAELIEELLQDGQSSPVLAARTLDALRRRLHGTDAVLWLVRDAGVRRAVHVSGTTVNIDSAMALRHGGAIERLRRNGTILCTFGDLSGVEELVPDAVKSFAAAAATRRDAVTCVLIIGWADPIPPCDHAGVVHLRTAAAMLERAVAPPSETERRPPLEEAILASVSDHIAVIDRQGTIIAVNAAWTDFGRREGVTTPGAIGPRVSYYDVCRRAASSGVYEAGTALEGIRRVCNGTSDTFEKAYAFQTAAGDEQSWLMTVTPLRRRQGGAVIVHSPVTRQKITEVAWRVGDAMFHRLADTIPAPVWIVSPGGLLMYGNQAWLDATAPTTVRGPNAPVWTETGHPDDRAEAASAFQAAVRRRERFEVELRLKAADGSYRWWSVVGVPRLAADGTVDSYVGICCDVTATRHIRHSYNELAGKIVTVQESERSRIARELHDDLGQQVALLASKLELGAHSRHRMLAGLTDARKNLQELATSIHNLSHDLHPAKLTLLGLGPTLETLCRNVSIESGLPISFDGDGIPAQVPQETALCVFRVTQEALQNAVKHGASRSIEVNVTGTHEHLTLRVIDNGAGFDPLASRTAGIGLLTMRERVELVGGKLRIETSHGRGTMIEATVPMAGAAHS